MTEYKAIHPAQQDLQWCYDRLSHLLFVWQNPKSVQGFFGPNETMDNLEAALKFIRERNNLTDEYPK